MNGTWKLSLHSAVFGLHWVDDTSHTSSFVKLDPPLGNYANFSQTVNDHISHS